MTAPVTAMNPITHSNPMVNGPGAGDNNATASSTISANDFLVLLVTEMKNQDPTAQTDPNAYVNQLVQVNSLQQLIEINENLSTALGDSTGSAQAEAVGTRMHSAHRPGRLVGVSESGRHGTTGVSSPIPVSANPVAAGNFGTFKPIPAAQRIAQALSGRH